MSTVWQPPVIPQRKPGWERSFVEILDRHVQEPFAWGRSDCLIVPADLCAAMTGIDPMKRLRRYGTETGALRILARLGFRSVEEALASVFPEISALRARRGDCGVLEQSVDGQPWLSTFVVMGDRAIGKGELGPTVVPTLSLKRCFAIGAIE